MQDDAHADTLDVRKTLAILRRREMWNVAVPATMASPTNTASIIAAIGRYDTQFVSSYVRFLQLLRNGSLGIELPDVPRVGHLEDNAVIIKFWVTAASHADKDVRTVALEACISCSIPLSQATVERSFGILTNHQSGNLNTLLAGPMYLRNLSMFVVNRTHLVSM